MSRFHKLAHTIWHCQYHIVWVPKYRFRILESRIKTDVYKKIQAICGYAGGTVVELNVQPDHVHLIVLVPHQTIDISPNGPCERSDGDKVI